MLGFGKTVLAALLLSAAVGAPAAGKPGHGDDAISEPPVSASAWLAETSGPNGTWRIFGYSCWDDRIDHVMLQHTWGAADLGRTAPGGVCVPHDQVPPDGDRAAPITGYLGGGDAWGLIIYFGVTAARIDAVDVKTERGWIRTNTIAPPDTAAAAGMPRGWRLYWVTVPWENNGPDGPFPLRGAVAIDDGRIAGCTREIDCGAGARARVGRRASRHHHVRWQRHRRGLGRRHAQ